MLRLRLMRLRLRLGLDIGDGWYHGRGVWDESDCTSNLGWMGLIG